MSQGSATKQLVRARTNGLWQEKWATGTTGKVLRRLVLQPNKTVLNKYRGLSRPLGTVLFQMRTGKIGLKNYLHRIGVEENNRCVCGSNQTVQHVLLNCTRFQDLRKQMWDGTTRETDLRELLTDSSHTAKAAKYMVMTGLLKQFRHVKAALTGEQPPEDDNW